MKRRFWQSAVVLAAAGLAVAVVQPSATAAPNGITVHLAADTAAEASAVAAKWTPEAMRDAIPLDRLLPSVNPTKLVNDVLRGNPQLVPGVQPAAFPEGGGEWTGGGKVATTAGRVFFTYQGRQASCSGNAVTSGNKSTVITAGHCVKLDGAFHTNWVFVPGYNNGNAPFGTWTARATMATPQWVASEDINYDVGAAVVNQLDGESLTDVVGGQSVAFNQPRGQNMYAFGYPAAAPYDGSKLIYCSGRVISDILLSNDLAMNCDMTGGSSGGPWFLSFNESTGEGIQNSVNSFKYNFAQIWMFGPYFGTDAQNLYNAAQTS
jgi:V8-like Glu-specific endopeptidase